MNTYFKLGVYAPMEHPALQKMLDMAKEPVAMEASISYLAENLSFLRKNESVLICFAKDKPGSHGELLEKAVLRCGAVPVMVDQDWRWKTLLRLAFSRKVTTLIAPPQVVLGISKLAKYNGTPLYIRNVVTAGYPCLDWMVDGIIAGLDCNTAGCFGPRGGAVISGFSCNKSRGVHLRDDVYGISIVDPEGKDLPDGQLGEMVLYPKSNPEIRFPIGERARLERTPCACGCASPRLMDMQPGVISDPDMEKLRSYLMSWTSVLDCRVKKGDYGLEMEVVVFPGEKLPKLPSAAKRVVKAWDSEKDEPFFYEPGIENK